LIDVWISLSEKQYEEEFWFDAKLSSEYGVSKPFNDDELLLKRL
jgi:hypothetical protein